MYVLRYCGKFTRYARVVGRLERVSLLHTEYQVWSTDVRCRSGRERDKDRADDVMGILRPALRNTDSRIVR